MLRGLMMDNPLLISSLLDHAAQNHADTEIVSRTVEGPEKDGTGALHRYTYAEAQKRAKQLAQALARLGVGMGDRVGTLAWNGYRHFELYFGVSGMGAVIHTVNPRLFPEQLVYIVNHADDKYVFFDLSFAPLVEKLSSVTREDLLRFYEGKVAKWWIPDDVTFVEQLPHTATGKLLKTKLRHDMKDYRLPK